MLEVQPVLLVRQEKTPSKGFVAPQQGDELCLDTPKRRTIFFSSKHEIYARFLAKKVSYSHNISLTFDFCSKSRKCVVPFGEATECAARSLGQVSANRRMTFPHGKTTAVVSHIFPDSTIQQHIA